MATKIIKALVDGVVQDIEVEVTTSPEQPLSADERIDELEDKHSVVITEGNLLVGNGTTELEEITPEDALSHIGGASVATMTTAEFEALEETNANTLYMLTDGEDDAGIVQADHNENDESSPAYIQNRTHWVESEIKELLPESTFTLTEEDDGTVAVTSPIGLVAGETYTVTWNGTEYECIAEDVSALVSYTCVIIGNVKFATTEGAESTGEPFMIMEILDAEMITGMGANGMIGAIDGSTEFVISISQEKATYHKLDYNYLPEGIGGGARMESGLTTLFPETTLIVAEEDMEFGITSPIGLIAGETYIVAWNGTEYKCVAEDMSELAGFSCIAIGDVSTMKEDSTESTGEPFAMMEILDAETIAGMGANGFGIVLDGSTAPVISIKGNGTTYIPFGYEYIPEGVPYIKKETTEIYNDTLTFTDAQAQLEGILLALVVGETYTVTWNGVEYECVAEDYDGSITTLGDLNVAMGSSNTSVPFVIAIQTSENRTLIATNDGSTTADIKIAQYKETVNKIDVKCLPDEYVTESELEENLSNKGYAYASDLNNLVGNTPVTTQISTAISAITPESIGAAASNHDHCEYITETTLESKNYITNEELESKNYIDSTTLESKGYVTESNMNTQLAETKGYIDTTLESANNYTDDKISNLVSNSTVDTKISTHNTATDAHNDIRTLIADLTTKLNAFLDVDDTTVDQLSEVLTLIENNKGTLESLTTSKVNVSDIVDNLTTSSTSKVLSANQGVVIKGLIDALQTELDGKLSTSGTAAKATADASGNVITSTYMTKNNPIGTGSLSLNRKVNTTIGLYSFAEGADTTASGQCSHAEGQNTIASGDYGSHSEGYYTTASGSHSHAEGEYTTASGSSSHAEGWNTIASGWDSHAEGSHTIASGDYSHAEGFCTTAMGSCSHAEGGGNNQLPDTITSSTDNDTIIETWKTTKFTLAKNDYSHAEGRNTLVLGDYSHAEGRNTIASGDYGSHSEGDGTTASGQCSHAEGNGTTANGAFSHAEGSDTVASGMFSHAEGGNTTASGTYQHVQGKYNIADSASTYAHIVGNGESDDARSNAHTLDWDGNAWFSGDVYVHSTSGTNKDEGSKKLVAAPTDAVSGDLLMYNGTDWVRISKADLIAEIIAALPSAEEASL